MNILIRFEDSYGCKTLFNHSKSVLNSGGKSVDILHSLGNTGVFKVSKREVANYDYVILVFDMDDMNNLSLNSFELQEQLNKHIMKNGAIKYEYSNKIILIPTFFCFETMYLFSKVFQEVIRNIDNMGDRTEHKLVKLYKQYYDYSILNPENLHNVEMNLPDIEKAAHNIAGSSTDSKWYPQRFHISYSKQLLQILCINKDKYTGCSLKKIFEKHEDILFDNLLRHESWFNVGDIIAGLRNQAEYNKLFYKLLTMQNVDELSEMTLDKNMGLISALLDSYNGSIRGKNTKRKINECKSNIESMIEGKSKCDIQKIRKHCKQYGFSDAEIDVALYELS